MSRFLIPALLLIAAIVGCGEPPSVAGPADQPSANSTPGDEQGQPGWRVLSAEDFESLELDASWAPDPVPDDGPFSDAGAFFAARGVIPPAGFRASVAFGDAGWLTAEAYTRSLSTPFQQLAAVVDDPAGAGNRVLRIASPAHTDGTVVRSTEPLPDRYRVSLRMGFADFGDGSSVLNGYDGGERALPWHDDDATAQNGFYWMAILDAQPRPHNNTWIHHHRKVVIDSDNHRPAWMEIFDGERFVWSGERPVMMFSLDGRGEGTNLTGKPFLSYAGGRWQASGAIRAADSYLPGEWYDVSIERSGTTYELAVSGRFQYGGETTYRARIDAAEQCVWHFNRSPEEDASGCADERSYPGLPDGFAMWPAGATWPDWLMFGDPHTNYYEGQVFYDDVRLEVWEP